MPTVDDVKDRILRVFYDFNVGAGEFLPIQSLTGAVCNFTPPEERLVDEALDALMRDGLLEEMTTPPGYRLTPTGETHAYGPDVISRLRERHRTLVDQLVENPGRSEELLPEIRRLEEMYDRILQRLN